MSIDTVTLKAVAQARHRFVQILKVGDTDDIMDAEADLREACEDLKRWAAQEAANRIADLKGWNAKGTPEWAKQIARDSWPLEDAE